MRLDPLARNLLAEAYVRQVTTGERLSWRDWARSVGYSDEDARRACMELNDRYLIECNNGCLRLRPAGVHLVETEGVGAETTSRDAAEGALPAGRAGTPTP
jgi:hypothetical protein